MPSIETLPTELVVFVLENLDKLKDLASLARASRALHETVDPVLYQTALARGDVWPLAWAAHCGVSSTLKKVLAAGADPNFLFVDTQPVDLWRRALAAARAPPDDDEDPGVWESGDDVESGNEWSAITDGSDSAVHSNGLENQSPAFFPWSSTTPDFDAVSGDASASASESETDDDDGRLSENASGADSSTLGYSDGIRISSSDSVVRGFTPLHLAARGGHNEAVGVLLDHGAFIDAVSENFCDCKHAVGLLNHVECPEFEKFPPAWTPLHVAICHCRLHTVKLLLARGADYRMEKVPSGSYSPSTSREDFRSTALHHAAATGQVDLVKYIVQEGYQTDIEVQDARWLTPLYYAYANDRWDSTFAALLEMGANINVEIKFFQPYCTITPLGESCRLGNFDICQKLIDLGADSHRGFFSTGTGHRKGLTPLQLCCMASARPAGPDRLDDITFENEDAGRGRIKLMQVLIANGLSIFKTDCSGDTPLITAVQNRVVPAVRALIKAGADIHAKNPLGRNALMQALLGPSHQMPGVAPPELDGALVEIFHELFRCGARIEDTDLVGNNILHLIFKGNPDRDFQQQTLRLLLNNPSASLLVLAKNNDGQSPFQLAFLTRNIEACEILVRRGFIRGMIDREELRSMFRYAMQESADRARALSFVLDLDVNRDLALDPALFSELVTEGGYAGLHAARAMCSRGLPPLSHDESTRLLRRAIHFREWDIAYHLIEAGADVNAVGDDGECPVGIFVKRYTAIDNYGLEHCLRILLDRGADIHLSPGPGQPPCARPLNRAIALGSDQLVALLLKGQPPLREDPRAVGGSYLHHALRIVPVEKRFPNEKVIDVLVAAGASVVELNENGDTPLSALLRALCAERYFTWRYHRYIKVLLGSGAEQVDVNQKNMIGKSVADYLEELMGTNASSYAGDHGHSPLGASASTEQQVHFLTRRLQLVDVADGAKEVKFLPPPRKRVKPKDVWRM